MSQNCTCGTCDVCLLLNRKSVYAKKNTSNSRSQSATNAKALIKAAKQPACAHLGEKLPGQPCGSDLHHCDRYGDTTAKIGHCKDAQRSCVGCPQYQQKALIAPAGKGLNAWKGAVPKKPWDYAVTTVIPHLNTPEPLEAVIELHRLQTERPYIVVIDTGSDAATCQRLEAMRAEDVEIHYLKSHAYLHSSEPVTMAMDFAFAVCRTPYLFATHADVFPRRRDLLAWYLGQMEEAGVIGYEMSERKGTDKWRGVVSHTATMFDMRRMRHHGINWNLLAYFERGYPRQEVLGWPDTESGLDWNLGSTETQVQLIGPESNYVRHVDDNIDHSRSYTGSVLYAGGQQLERAKAQMRQSLSEAKERIEQWRTQIVDLARGGDTLPQ